MSDANRTQLLSDPNRTQMGAPPTADPNKTMMGVAPTLNATQIIKPTQCPVCKTFNPAGVMFCIDCGLIFDRALDGDAFGAPAVQVPMLVDSTGREHPVRPGVNSIGREGDILLTDSRASRKHAQISSTDAGLVLEDLGSTNGTKVDGRPVAAGERVNLAGSETISIGGIELKLTMPGGGPGGNATQNLAGNRTAAISAPPAVETAPAMLVGEGQRLPLKVGVNSFGRKSADNDIAIVDAYVSGKHGLIEVTDDGFYITDIGSTNGTMLNDAKLAPNMRTAITPQDVIRLGSLEYRIEPAAKQAE
jgi:pSer/pThr/pTyr-binding forkhead associated (FHA) protein